MSLQEKLDEIRTKGFQNVDVKAVYDAVLTQLGRGESASQVLRPGDSMPAFLLPSSDGRLVSSEELLQRTPLVVSFFRGDWCPYCRTMLDAYQAALPAIVAAGGQLVAITPDTGAVPTQTKHKHRLAFDVLSDAESGVALQFGLVFRLPDNYRALLDSRGVDLGERHGNKGWFIPIPATFVVDRSGIIRDAFVDIDFTKRAEPDQVVEALRALQHA